MSNEPSIKPDSQHRPALITRSAIPICLICSKPVPGYVPEYCCSGQECGCGGEPREPCVCSEECYEAVFSWIGIEYEARRIKAGIEKFQPNH